MKRFDRFWHWLFHGQQRVSIPGARYFCNRCNMEFHVDAKGRHTPYNAGHA